MIYAVDPKEESAGIICSALVPIILDHDQGDGNKLVDIGFSIGVLRFLFPEDKKINSEQSEFDLDITID